MKRVGDQRTPLVPLGKQVSMKALEINSRAESGRRWHLLILSHLFAHALREFDGGAKNPPKA